MASYTKNILLEKLELASENISTFYQQDFINYRGKTSDTNEYYSEVIAQWCCEHLELFNKIQTITREQPYKVQSHNGINTNLTSNRKEEQIAMEIFLQGQLPLIGKVIDYQTPLKNKRSDIAGKIDLLSYDNGELHILELKKPDSDETMLRCVLEGYTYLRTVNRQKLLTDFELPGNTNITASPLVFFNSLQYKEMQEERPQLKRLMYLLNSKAFYVIKKNDEYFVEK